MHYDIHYDKLKPAQAEIQAVLDTKDWLGEEKFAEIVGMLRQAEPMIWRDFSFLMGVAGVQGYPVVAMHRFVWGATEHTEGASNV